MASAKDTRCAAGRGRVLMLAPHPEISGPIPGPIAKVAYRLADALRSVGFEVDVELWGRHQREEGLVRKVTGRFGDLVRIRRRIATGAYDLVYINTTHDTRALLRDLLLVLPSPSRIRWVLLIHGSHFAPGRPLFDLGARTLVRRARATLLLSTDEVVTWQAFCPEGRYHLVANALATAAPGDVRGTARVADETPDILFAGRLIREKGLYELLEAFASLHARRPCRLTIAGEGPEDAGLRERCAELGISDTVEFTGHLTEADLAALYAAADVLVLPSYSEGLPTVLLEAMSAGLPIVTTRIRGAADHLTDGVNALFVPAAEVTPLADALGRILDDPELRAAMCASNLAKAADFAPDHVVLPYARVFDAVIEGTDR